MGSNSIIEAQIEFEEQRSIEWEKVSKRITETSDSTMLVPTLDMFWAKLYPEQPRRPLVTAKLVWLDFSQFSGENNIHYVTSKQQ